MSSTTETISVDQAMAEGAAAVAAAQTQKSKKAKTPVDPMNMTIIGKQVINKWAHAQGMNVGGEVFTALNQFVLAISWRHVLQFNAPEQTPDIGVVFSRLTALISHQIEGGVEIKDARRAARNISFLIWASLNAVKDLLSTIKRKRLSFDFVFPVLLASYNTSLAAIGAPPAAIEIHLPEKKKAAGADASNAEASNADASTTADASADAANAEESSAVKEPPPKKKKTNSKNVPSASMVTLEDPMVVH